MTCADACRQSTPASSASSSPRAAFVDAVDQQPQASACGPRQPSCTPSRIPATSGQAQGAGPSCVPQARRDLREAQLQLAAIAYIWPGEAAPQAAAPAPAPPNGPAHLGSTGTLAAFSQVPQYDRTHVPGCVCRPALAGGACCPGNVGGMTLQQMAGPHCGAVPHVQLGSLVAAGLGAAGLVSGMQVMRDAKSALANLHAVAQHARRQEAEASVWRQELAAYPKLQAAHAHVAHRQLGLTLLRRDLQAATAEQRFYRWVPGRLQIAASLGVILSAAHHHVGLGLSVVGGALVGASSSGLFALYGLAMAAKNFRAWQSARAAAPPRGIQHLPQAYVDAFRAHRGQALAQARLTGAAWLGVATAGALSCAVTLGLVALPHAWAITGSISLVSGVAAMWSNSCSRYTPHLPVSPHMQRDALVTSAQRGALFVRLQRQQACIAAANTVFAAGAGVRTRLRMAWEQSLKPQCGAESFQVLARVVAGRSRIGEPQGDSHGRELAAAAPASEDDFSDASSTRSDSTANTREDDGVARPSARADQIAQLHGVIAYLREERAIWYERHAAALAQAQARARELTPLVDPGCATMQATAAQALADGAPSRAIYGRAAHELQNDTRELSQAVTTLGAVDALLATCQTLMPHVGTLAIVDADAITPPQKLWLQIRTNVLQLGGLLRDALTKDFVLAHGHMLKSRGAAHVWPLGNMSAMPAHYDALMLAMASQMESGFVHAFFNPRRIEAEMDYLLQMEAAVKPAFALQMGAPGLGSQVTSPLADIAPQMAQDVDFGASAATCCG